MCAQQDDVTPPGSEREEKSSAATLNRRKFMLATAAMGVGAVAVIPNKLADKAADAGIDGVGTAARAIVSPLLGYNETLSEGSANLAKMLLFGSNDQTIVIPSQINPFRKVEGISAPTKFIADYLISTQLRSRKQIKYEKKILDKRLAGNLLCLGGPASNHIAQQIMGLNGTSMLTQDLRGVRPIRFPYWLDIEFSKKQMRSGNHRRVERIIYPIADMDIQESQWEVAPIWFMRSGNKFLSPAVENGIILNDFLHIVSLPNFLCEEAYEHKRRIVICFGSHGAGTRALKLLAQNDKLMEKILDKTKKMAGWHCIIPVDNLSDNGKLPLSVASNFEVYQINGEFSAVARSIQREKRLCKIPDVACR